MRGITRRSLTWGLPVAPMLASAAGATRWEARAPILWSVQEVYAAVWRGQLAIAGGMTIAERRIRALDRAAFYDPASDAWREGPRMPFGRHHPALAAVGDRLFAFGGFSTERAEWTATRDALAFDGERWTPAPPLPRIQCETVALTIGANVHLVSGRSPAGQANANWTDHVDVDLHQVFDAREGRWRSARPAPMARNSAAGAVIDGRLYLVGGRTVSGGNTPRLDRYDPVTDVWETLRPLPRPSGGLAAATAGGRLYAFGGEGGPGVIADCWSYDPASDAWRAEPPMRTPRHGLAAAALGGRVYAIGGAVREGAGSDSAVLEALVLG